MWPLHQHDVLFGAFAAQCRQGSAGPGAGAGPLWRGVPPKWQVSSASGGSFEYESFHAVDAAVYWAGSAAAGRGLPASEGCVPEWSPVSDDPGTSTSSQVMTAE